MKTEITYSGSLIGMAEELEQRISEAISAGAEAVRSDAESICPVDTGTLKRSIAVSQNGLTAEISANTDYAAYVEFGTSKMAAQPYLVPSLLGNEEKIISAICGQLGGNYA